MDQQARLDFLKQLIAIDTAGGHEEKVSLFLKDSFAKHGITAQLVEVEPGRHDVIAKLGTGNGPVLAFEGHQDTVAIGEKDQWQHDPLGAEIVGDKVYGRGTTDMKAGLAAEALALMELADEGAELNGTLEFIATVAEESSQHNHMQGAQTLVKKGLIQDVDAIIIAEPSDSQLDFAHKGSITYRVSSVGKTAHSSMPQLGYNAIKPLVHYYNLQEEYFKSFAGVENQYLGKTVPVVTKIDGGQQLNSVPDYAELFAKVRTIPEISNDEIWQHIKAMIKQVNEEDGAQLSLTVLGDKIPVVTDPNAPFIKTLHRVAEEKLQRPVAVQGIAFGTDASELSKGNDHFSMAVLGPGNKTAHAINEWVSLTTYYEFIEMFNEIAKQYLK